MRLTPVSADCSQPKQCDGHINVLAGENRYFAYCDHKREFNVPKLLPLGS